VLGAQYGERSDERTNSRNGYRPREWDSRAGTVELAIAKLRTGSYFPDWLLQHRRRAEQALVSVVDTSYLLGVSTRRVEKLIEQLGIKQLSKSQVSEMARHLDAQVEAFRNRPLDDGPYTFVRLDALVIKVREHGRTINVHTLAAVGVNADGGREVLGLDVASDEDGVGWLAFLRSVTARGLSGVRLVISDAHRGLVSDRRRAARRRLATMPHRPAQPPSQGAQERAAVGGQPDPHHLRPARHRRRQSPMQAGPEHHRRTVPDAAEHLERRPRRPLGVHRVPARVVAADLVEQRLNKEIRRRTDVVRIFPNRAAIIRLVGAVLAEQTDEWVEGRRYMGLDILRKGRLTPITTSDNTEPTSTPTEIAA
jgi:putative transposase